MTTVLVSGASGVVGYGIARSLRRLAPAPRIVGTTIHEGSAAEGFCDVVEIAPRTDAPGYLDWLRATAARHRADLLVPGIEDDVFRWSESASALADAPPRVLNEPGLIALCRDKWAFHERLQAAAPALAIETTLEADFAALRDRFGLPFVLKPRRGYGGRGLVRVASEADFGPHRARVGPELLAQRLVGTDDAEFTTAAFGDGHGGLHARMTLRRTLSREGFTERAEVDEPAGIPEAVAELCALFRPVGPTNFQFRRDRGGFRLLEINPRISSATSIRAAFGYNESAMALEYHLHGRVPVPPEVRPGRAVRYVEDLIFPAP